MRLRKRLVATGAAVATATLLASTGSAMAAFPNFADCPATPNRVVCIDIQSRTGFLDIKGFSVPIGESFGIRGALRQVGDGAEFVPPTGTSGVFSKPIQIPGGILGIDLPLSFNKVTATAQLAGSPSAIRVNTNDFSVSLPLKLKLSNPLIGPGCQIGSNSAPVHLNLITGTTSPPAPNRPISGRIGSFSVPDQYTIVLNGNENVDNAFSIPGASSCGLGLGLFNQIINLKMKLPSAAGNNTMRVGNDVAIRNGQI